MCILNKTKFILKCNLNFVCVQKKVIYTPKKLIAVMSGDQNYREHQLSIFYNSMKYIYIFGLYLKSEQSSKDNNAF